MYEVNYYINKLPYRYEFNFNSLWGAIFKARAIHEEHGLATDVMDRQTGEIVAIFEPNNTWISEEFDTEIRKLALQALT